MNCRSAVEWPDWRGQVAVIVATGPSVADAPLIEAKGRARIIVIKTSWRLAPWADVLYQSDGSWWERHRGVPEFCGLKVTASPRAARLFGLMQVSPVGRGGHSGSHAIHLAMDFGASRVVLVGFDLPLLDVRVSVFDGVEIINASPVSALKAYRKAGLMEAIKG